MSELCGAVSPVPRQHARLDDARGSASGRVGRLGRHGSTKSGEGARAGDGESRMGGKTYICPKQQRVG